MKPKRFAFVSAPGREIVHMFTAKRFTEGEPTECGVRVQQGWPFWYRQPKKPTWGDVFGRKCKRCFPTAKAPDA